jgi:anti-sigma B factor antagonist
MQIDKTRVDPDITVVSLTGRLVMGRESQRVEWMVEELLGQNEKKLILDLTKVDYIDSSGLGMIASCFGKVKQSGGGLRLVGANERVQNVFKMTGLAGVVAVHPSVADACQDFPA